MNRFLAFAGIYVVLAASSAPGAPAVPNALGGRVLVVDAFGGGDYLDIQPAVKAAGQQDTILVRPGTYGGFLVANRSLSLVADSGQPPRINGFVTINNLPGGRPVSFSGFHFKQGFAVVSCDASVLFVDCTFVEPGLAPFPGCVSQTAGIHLVQTCDDVTFVGCQLIGRDGSSAKDVGGVLDGGPGDPGLYIVSATVTLYSCTVRGGAGAESSDGQSLGCIDAWKGNGGDGIRVLNNSFLYLDGTSPEGGPGGPHTWCCCCGCGPGADGDDVDIDPTSTLATASHAPLFFDSVSVERANHKLAVTLEGPADAPAWMIWSEDPDRRFLGTNLGILHLKSGKLNFLALGKIPPGGSLQTDLTLPSIPMGDDFLRLYLEPFAIHAGTRFLGNVRRVVVLDPAF